MKRLFVCGCVAMLAACGASAPKCGDQETTTLVKQIAHERLSKGWYSEVIGLQLQLGAVRTSDHDEATGKQSCVAELTMSWQYVVGGERKSTKKEIRYTSELTSKADEFYVSVEDF